MSSARQGLQRDGLSQRLRPASEELERAHVLSEALDDVPGAEGIGANDLRRARHRALCRFGRRSLAIDAADNDSVGADAALHVSMRAASSSVAVSASSPWTVCSPPAP